MGEPAPLPATCCSEAITLAVTVGIAAQCPTCGTVWLPSDELGERPSDVDLRPPPRRHAPLSEVLDAVQLALAWRGENDVSPRASAAPIARMQGRVDIAPARRSARTIAALWQVVCDPQGRAGRDDRKGFVDALVEYCETTSRSLDEAPDWNVARTHAKRLGRLDVASRRVLIAIARRCRASVGWEEASLVAADECAPPTLRAQWTSTRSATRALPPPELAALAWGEEALTTALVAWSTASTGA